MTHFPGSSRVSSRGRGAQRHKPSILEALHELLIPKVLNLKIDTKVSGGSIVGSSHVGGETLLGKNNQDALQVEITEGEAIFVVCDGCSMGKHSEVGSKMLSKIILNAFKVHAKNFETAEKIVAAVEKTAIEKLQQIADSLTSDTSLTADLQTRKSEFNETLNQYFAATIMGAYCTPDKCFIWGLGDGVYGYNLDGVTKVEVVRAENNAPAYLFYNLFKDWPADIPRKNLSVYKEFDQLPECIMIGSDGVEDIIKLKGKNFPGTTTLIPGLEELLVNKQYLRSPSAILEFLGRMQALVAEPEIQTTVIKRDNYQEIGSRVFVTQKGRYLPDDTTMVLFGKSPKPVQPRALSDLSIKSRKIDSGLPDNLL